jgi:hypothetical protein
LLSIARSVLASGPVVIRFTDSGTPLLGDCWTGQQAGFGNNKTRHFFGLEECKLFLITQYETQHQELKWYYLALTICSLNVCQGTEGLEDFQYETILGFQDPHLVGIATKRPTITTTSTVSKDKVPKKSKKSRP